MSFYGDLNTFLGVALPCGNKYEMLVLVPLWLGHSLHRHSFFVKYVYFISVCHLLHCTFRKYTLSSQMYKVIRIENERRQMTDITDV